MKYITYKKYLNTLIKNQNDTNIPCLQDIYTEKDYKKILKPVMKVISENPYASLTSLRLKLFLQSGLKEIIDNFVKDTQITPGLILDFGTFKNRDTVICGNRQEYVMKNGILVKDELPIEQNTIFDLASTSKTFTAVAILILAEDKLIDVFEPVTKYVPEFKNLGNTTIYDLLKFRVSVATPSRIDSAKNKEEALNILYQAYPRDVQPENAYTDIGAMILRVLVEKVTCMKFHKFVETMIFRRCGMYNTYLNVPSYDLDRVANENYSTIITQDGSAITRYDNVPGTVHDPKANAIGQKEGIAPGHAGFFSTKDDMIKFAKALIDERLITKDSLLSMSDTETGFKDDDKYTRFYGSLVYLKQPDPEFLSVYPPLSGRAFMSPGFAGTQLVVDPINKISLFVGSPRLHNRIYQVHKSQVHNIKVDEHNKKTFVMPDGTEKIVCCDYTKAKEVLVTLALDLAIQYQLLENLYPNQKEMHLVRELN